MAAAQKEALWVDRDREHTRAGCHRCQRKGRRGGNVRFHNSNTLDIAQYIARHERCRY